MLLLPTLVLSLSLLPRIAASSMSPVNCIMHGGLRRCWQTYVPPSTAGTASAAAAAAAAAAAGFSPAAVPPLRLVVNLHGYGGNFQSLAYTKWQEVADREGLILVMPAGTEHAERDGTKAQWNAGACCGKSSDGGENIDDVGFLRAVVTNETTARGINALKHVYWAGHSNGCAMAQRMAKEASDIVAAVGCHALYLLETTATPPTAAYRQKPVPIITIHGTADRVVGYSGFLAQNGKTYSALGKIDTTSRCVYVSMAEHI